MMKQKRKKYIPKQKNNKNTSPSPDTLSRKPLNIKFFLLSHILIIFLGCMAYANSLNGKFIYDDVLLIERNLTLKNPSEILTCFTKSLFAGVGVSTTFYRPLQMASYVINYAFCQLKFRGHVPNYLSLGFGPRFFGARSTPNLLANFSINSLLPSGRPVAP